MRKLLKPRILNDIQPAGRSVYRAPVRRVNLSYRRTVNVSVTNFLKMAIVGASSWFLILGSVAAPTTTTLTASAATAADERAQLEAQLKEIEAQIDQYEGQIVSYQKQGSSLKGEVNRLNNQISKLNLQIKAITLSLADLDLKINDTQSKIAATEQSIASKKQVLGNLLKDLYETDRATLMEIFLKNPEISDFFNNVNSVTVLQGNLRKTIADITNLKNELQEEKDQFALARADAATIRNYQLAQKTQTDRLKEEKNKLITVTKNKESEYQKLVAEKKKQAAEIRNRLFEFLGGGALKFGDAYELAKLASQATGVRPALILAVLDRESALGQNVGKCKYNQINSVTGRPTMHPTRDKPAFLEITKELGLDPEDVFVSCAIPRDGAYGGAMGPAQFIPSTWMQYKGRIAAFTGSQANPWNNRDAFIATAFYLKDAGAANASIAKEREAAAKYYAGGNWSRFLWTYGEAVVSRANRFEQDILDITS